MESLSAFQWNLYLIWCGIERAKENPTLNTLVKLSESLEVNLGEIFKFIKAEGPAKRKSMIISLLDETDDELLKLILKMLLIIIH